MCPPRDKTKLKTDKLYNKIYYLIFFKFNINSIYSREQGTNFPRFGFFFFHFREKRKQIKKIIMKPREAGPLVP